MDFVDGDGPVVPARLPPPFHPVAVAPRLSPRIAHDGRGGRWMLRPETHRVGLERQQRAAGAPQLELVAGALRHPGQESLPHAGRSAPAHGVAPPVPVVEVADDRDPPRVGRPEREVHAGDSVSRQGVRPQHLPEVEMRAFAQKVLVLLPQHRAEAEGIVLLPDPVAAAHPQAIGAGVAAEPGGEETLLIGGTQRHRSAVVVLRAAGSPPPRRDERPAAPRSFRSGGAHRGKRRDRRARRGQGRRSGQDRRGAGPQVRQNAGTASQMSRA